MRAFVLRGFYCVCAVVVVVTSLLTGDRDPRDDRHVSEFFLSRTDWVAQFHCLLFTFCFSLFLMTGVRSAPLWDSAKHQFVGEMLCNS